MKYRLHTTYEHGEFGWYVLKESTDLEEFDAGDKWAFNHILTEGVEYVKVGNFMWDIQEVTMNNDLVQMKNDLLQMFKVQVEETYEMTEKTILLQERLDKLKNIMRSQDILSNDVDRFFSYLDSMIRLHREGGNLWIYLPTKKVIDVLNKLGNATTEKEVESILSPVQSEF